MRILKYITKIQNKGFYVVTHHESSMFPNVIIGICNNKQNAKRIRAENLSARTIKEYITNKYGKIIDKEN